MDRVLLWAYLLIQLSASASQLTVQQQENKVELQTFVPNIPEECLDIRLCENVPNYPKEHVTGVLTKLDNLRPTKVKDVDRLNIKENRLQHDPEFSPCDSREKRIIPEAGRDKHGNWYFILNRKQNSLYRFIAIRCSYLDRPAIFYSKNRTNCTNFATFVDWTGHERRGVCEQKYTDIKMRALDRRGNVKEMIFSLESCCCCVATLNIEEFTP